MLKQLAVERAADLQEQRNRARDLEREDFVWWALVLAASTWGKHVLERLLQKYLTDLQDRVHYGTGERRQLRYPLAEGEAGSRVLQLDAWDGGPRLRRR